MSTVRYTLGGDYDRADDHKLEIRISGSPLDVIEPYLEDEFVIHGPGGYQFIAEFNYNTDGVYANFKDNVWGASMTGGQLGDVLIGGSGNDKLAGQAGDDDLTGGVGNDKLNGGLGNDTMHGGDGNDQLSGRGGEDVLAGGAGQDLLSGGNAADRFHFLPGDTAADAASADTITDFKQARHDLIDLSDYDADPATRARDPFHFVGAAAFSGTVGELRYEFAGGDTLVSGDTNGDALADFTIRLTGAVTLTDADFLLAAVPAPSVGHALSLHADFAGHLVPYLA
jgi:Ca2+-binding RTX toxin-like protein